MNQLLVSLILSPPRFSLKDYLELERHIRTKDVVESALPLSKKIVLCLNYLFFLEKFLNIFLKKMSINLTKWQNADFPRQKCICSRVFTAELFN